MGTEDPNGGKFAGFIVWATGIWYKIFGAPATKPPDKPKST